MAQARPGFVKGKRRRWLGAVCTSVALIATLASAVGAWTTERYEMPADIPRDAWPLIAVDALGHHHVVFRDGSQLGYLTDKSGSWRRRIITRNSNGIAEAADIHVSASGRVYVAFVRHNVTPDSQNVRWATNASGSWVEHPGSHFVGEFEFDPISWPKLAVHDGRVSLVYSGRNALWLRTFETDGTDHLEKVGGASSGGTASDNLDVAVDAHGSVHIAQVNPTGVETLDYWTNRSGAWVRSRLQASSTERTFSPHLAVEAGGRPHIAFRYCRSAERCSEGRYTVIHATRSGGAWQWESLKSPAEFTTYPAGLALGPAGTVHVAYVYEYADNFIPDGVRYLTNESGGWAGRRFEYPAGGRQLDSSYVALHHSGGLTRLGWRESAGTPETFWLRFETN